MSDIYRKSDSYMESNTEKRPAPIQNLSKEIKSDNFSYPKVRRAITILGAKFAPKFFVHFGYTNIILVSCIAEKL